MQISEKIRAIPVRLKIWIMILIVTTLIAGLAFGLVQQALRQSANDPQTQLAEDLTNAYNSGAQPQDLIPSGQSDITTSLAPFAAVYDGSGKPLVASGQINKQSPTLPSGVFDYVSKHSQENFTWQPTKDFRAALVVKKANSGYIMVGRSFREVEMRENNLQLITLVGWAATLVLSLIALTILF